MSGERQSVQAPAERPFGFWTATALVVGGMIASGIFMIPATLAPFGWTGVLAWAISIGGVLSIAFTLSRLAQTMPQATGAIAVAGAVLGELPGVLVGWSYWVSVWAANAAIAIAAASYVEVLVPGLQGARFGGAVLAVGFALLPSGAGPARILLGAGGALSALGAYAFAYNIWQTIEAGRDQTVQRR